MRLAVFGATGRLGLQVLRAAQARGHAVAAHSRSPQKRSTQEQGEDGIQWVTGAVTNALRGADAVILAFGPRSPADKPFCTIETREILEAMHRCGVVRILCVTGAMVGHYPENRSWLFQQLASWVQRRYPESMVDRATQEDLVRSSGLDWTIFKPPRLTMNPSGDVTQQGARVRVGLLSAIARCDLARLLVDEAEQQRFNGQAVFVKG